MKNGFHKKHPLTSVDLIPEGKEEECLTEEQAKQFEKIGLRVVRLANINMICTLFAIPLLFLDVLSNAMPKLVRIVTYIGYAAFGIMIVSLIFLFIERRKISKLAEKFEQENKTTDVSSS